MFTFNVISLTIMPFLGKYIKRLVQANIRKIGDFAFQYCLRLNNFSPWEIKESVDNVTDSFWHHEIGFTDFLCDTIYSELIFFFLNCITLLFLFPYWKKNLTFSFKKNTLQTIMKILLVGIGNENHKTLIIKLLDSVLASKNPNKQKF